MMPTKTVNSVLAIAVIVVCAWLLILTFWGYGHATIHLQPGMSAEINGHRLGSGANELKLRPGTYRINVTSARYFSTSSAIQVSLFSKTSYTPQAKPRSPLSIAESAVGVSVLAGSLPTVEESRWFGDDWIVEEVGPSTPDVLAAHFQNGQWQEIYLTGNGESTSSLPVDIARAVTNREAAINASNQ